MAEGSHHGRLPPRRCRTEGVALVAGGLEGRADVRDFDPGYDITATVSADLRILTGIWRGDVSWSRALHDGSVVVAGSGESGRGVAGLDRSVEDRRGTATRVTSPSRSGTVDRRTPPGNLFTELRDQARTAIYRVMVADSRST